MKQLALYDFIRHRKRNLFVAGLLAALCLLLTSLYSLLRYEYGRYKPFEALGIKNGYFLGDISSDYSRVSPELWSLEEIISRREGIKKVYQVYSGGMQVNGSFLRLYIYEDWAWSSWQGRLKSGRWFQEKDIELGAYPVILGGSEVPYSVGDVLSCRVGAAVVGCTVKGILQEGTELLYSPEFSQYKINYEACYSVPEEPLYCLMQKEVADAIGINSYVNNLWGVAEFDENLSPEEAEALGKELAYRRFYTGRSYETFLDVSKGILKEKLFAYLPLMITGVILVFVALFVAAFINAEKGSRYYCIYYLVGGTKRSCFLIACGNVLGTVAVSALFYVLLEVLLKMVVSRENILYSPMAGARLLAVGLYLLFALFLTLCLYFAMKKNSPLALLRKHR